jgi:hypothetical protein
LIALIRNRISRNRTTPKTISAEAMTGPYLHGVDAER